MDCVFCGIKEDGDIPDNHEDLIDEDVVIKSEVAFRNEDVEISARKDEHLGIFVGAYGTNGGELWAGIINGENEMVFDKSVPINYCPMCGRKL